MVGQLTGKCQLTPRVRVRVRVKVRVRVMGRDFIFDIYRKIFAISKSGY